MHITAVLADQAGSARIRPIQIEKRHRSRLNLSLPHEELRVMADFAPQLLACNLDFFGFVPPE
jgi:hypothetical protein